MTYQRRVLDAELDLALAALPAVAIDGAKAVGKTSTMEQRARTVVRLDDPAAREPIAADPRLILSRSRPVLIDEWQLVPTVWDVVRRAVDADRAAAQFLLTGSATPQPGATAHTGAGRITRIRMRPLAWSERGYEPAPNSLSGLLAGNETVVSGETELALDDYTKEIMASGLPGLRSLPGRLARAEIDSYLMNAVDRDVPELGLAVRKPAIMLDWWRAYAAATSSTASYHEIAAAATAGLPDPPARTTVTAYRDALQRLWLLDPLPAWRPIGQEFARLASAPKHHVADPAFAARLLGLTETQLLNGAGKVIGPQQGGMLGRLFESLVALSVRVLAQHAEADVGHLRTRNGDREIDLVLTSVDGGLLPIEVKLGATVSDHDTRHLKWFREKYANQLVDAIVINTGPTAYRRPDGIAVIPLALLAP